MNNKNTPQLEGVIREGSPGWFRLADAFELVQSCRAGRFLRGPEQLWDAVRALNTRRTWFSGSSRFVWLGSEAPASTISLPVAQTLATLWLLRESLPCSYKDLCGGGDKQGFTRAYRHVEALTAARVTRLSERRIGLRIRPDDQIWVYPAQRHEHQGSLVTLENLGDYLAQVARQHAPD